MRQAPRRGVCRETVFTAFAWLTVDSPTVLNRPGAIMVID
jgi:hypothetical protein